MAPGASHDAPVVWCAYPEHGFHTRPWRLLAWAAFIASVLNGENLSLPVSAGWLCLAMAVDSLHVASLSFASDAHYHADSLAVPTTLLSLMFGLAAVLLYSRRIYSSPLATPVISAAVYCFAVACVLVQHILIPALFINLPNSLLESKCNDQGTCTNPCIALSKALKRDDGLLMAPVIWEPTDAKLLSDLGKTNEWIRNAASIAPGIDFLVTIPVWYFLLGPVLYAVFTNLVIPPRAARNRIFQSLQESHRPRDEGQSRIKFYGRWFLLKFRYLRYILKPISLALQVKLALYTTIKGAADVRRKGKTPEAPPNFIVVPLRSAFRREFGKLVAAGWYIWALSLYLWLPILTIALAVKAELNLGWLPSSNTQLLPTWFPLILIGAILFVGIAGIVERAIRGKPRDDVDGSGSDRAFNSGSLFDLGHQADSHLPIHRWVVALASREWREFQRWWRDPVAVSSVDGYQSVEDGENGGYNTELNGWAHRGFGYQAPSSRSSRKSFSN